MYLMVRVRTHELERQESTYIYYCDQKSTGHFLSFPLHDTIICNWITNSKFTQAKVNTVFDLFYLLNIHSSAQQSYGNPMWFGP